MNWPKGQHTVYFVTLENYPPKFQLRLFSTVCFYSHLQHEETFDAKFPDVFVHVQIDYDYVKKFSLFSS